MNLDPEMHAYDELQAKYIAKLKELNAIRLEMDNLLLAIDAMQEAAE